MASNSSLLVAASPGVPSTLKLALRPPSFSAREQISSLCLQHTQVAWPMQCTCATVLSHPQLVRLVQFQASHNAYMESCGGNTCQWAKVATLGPSSHAQQCYNTTWVYCCVLQPNTIY
jgi:hypothetical protein